MNRIKTALLSLSVAGLLAIAGFEGFSDKVYIPVPGDLPTIGFGHADPRLTIGERISKQQAVDFLSQDVQDAQRAVQKCVHVPLTQFEFDAYVSFAYNVGERQFCTSTLVRKLNSGDYSGACEGLKAWVYSGGIKYKGLETRRKIETLICKTGQYPNTPSWLNRFIPEFENAINPK